MKLLFSPMCYSVRNREGIIGTLTRLWTGVLRNLGLISSMCKRLFYLPKRPDHYGG